MAKTKLKPEQIKKILKNNSYVVISEESISNDTGVKFNLETGEIVCIYRTGSLVVNGKGATKQVEELLLNSTGEGLKVKKKVFVVYGHDRTAKTELEGMLLRWDLEPISLDRLPSESNTLIEQLEKYIKEEEVDYAIVLMTPDDEGYPKGLVNEIKYRPRQNVILELGMVLGKLQRKHIAVLVKKISNFEYPSDVNGVLYIAFGEKLEEEVRVRLSQEMNLQGFDIDLRKL